PILRLRIDRFDAAEGQGVTLEDCTRVSRALEAWLDEKPDLPERYVLEVSSPGIERPLVRRRDFERFAGREVAIQAKSAIHGNSRRVEGTLLGIDDSMDDERILLRTSAGEELAVPRERAMKVHLVYRWGEEGRGG